MTGRPVVASGGLLGIALILEAFADMTAARCKQ